MNPALIMLLVVAAVFLGFSLLPSRTRTASPKKETVRSSPGKAGSAGMQRQPYIVPSKSTSEHGSNNDLGLHPVRSEALKRSYVILARALAYIDIDELAPNGHVLFTDVVSGMVERYQFQKFPSKIEEFDRDKGVEFSGGMAGRIPIQRLAIFDTLLLVETRSNTNDSREILLDMLAWAAKTFALSFDSAMIKRWGYISSVVFHSDSSLLYINPALAKIGKRITAMLSESWDEEVEYKPIRVSVGHDPDIRKWAIAPFTIERKGQARFSENKYFSEAPVPTSVHWEILEEFEDEILMNSASNEC